ncbi:protein of unknown function [Hyphomicrobium sp. MC1]|nr:protein of unknown function [Hyphomicrobium sp. MC1]
MSTPLGSSEVSCPHPVFKPLFPQSSGTRRQLGDLRNRAGSWRRGCPLYNLSKALISNEFIVGFEMASHISTHMRMLMRVLCFRRWCLLQPLLLLQF